MLARDMGVPTTRVGPSARVIINVIRNLHPPQFRSEPYQTSILQTQATGSQVLQVQAEDKDSKVTLTRGQDYKDKEKLDSKQISNSMG